MSYVHTLKRIRTDKTNYRKREAMLLGRQNFVTIKITNQNLIAQILKPEILGDIVKVSAYSRELRRYGWKGSLNSLPACYLAGALLGKKA
jgi:large subunit ribosomal protein L18